MKKDVQIWRGQLNRPPEAEQFAPPFDVEESNTAYRISVELLGYDVDQLSLKLDGNQLYLVAGDRTARAFAVPADVDTDEIRAEFRDGVVYLLLPKQDLQRRIRVEQPAA